MTQLPNEAPPKNPLTAPQMFALYPTKPIKDEPLDKYWKLVQEGPDECHWCAGPCQRVRTHDDAPVVPFQKTKTLAKRPNNGYVCLGCEIYRRKRVTIKYLNGEFKDGKCLMNYSWWIDTEGPQVIDGNFWSTPDCKNIFREKLLNPPNSFCFSLISEGQQNHLQRCLSNDLCVVKAETMLNFTFDGIPHRYSIYELKNAFANGGGKGLEPGTQLLVELCGGPDKKVKKEHGRPKVEWEESPKFTVSASGQLTQPQ